MCHVGQPHGPRCRMEKTEMSFMRHPEDIQLESHMEGATEHRTVEFPLVLLKELTLVLLGTGTM